MLVAAGEGSGGVDIALGPNVGCSPLGLLGPAAILQGLLAGPGTEDPRKMTAALPVVGCQDSAKLAPVHQLLHRCSLADALENSNEVIGIGHVNNLPA